MTFLAPAFLWAGLAAGVIVTGLHFLVTRPPPLYPLPTARFIPRSSVVVTTFERRPEDLPLLLARVLALLLLGAAFARPILASHRREIARVVVADYSRAVGDITEVRDSVGAMLGAADALVVFDSAARLVDNKRQDSIARLVRSGAPGSLSAALIVALRAASHLSLRADSIELAVVSPLAAEEVDAATALIRAQWPGRIRFIHIAARPDTADAFRGLIVRAPATDPIAIAARLLGPAGRGSNVRVVRDSGTVADSLWAEAGGVLLRWPATAGPPGWVARTPEDTSGAVIAGDAVMVFPFVRHWVAAAGGRVIARWVDGEPAAVERVLGRGCVRDLGMTVPSRGDVMLRPEFADLLRRLAGPCGGGGSITPLADSVRIMLAGAGALAAGSRVARPEDLTTPLVPWLLAAALALLLVEQGWRRRPKAGPERLAAQPLGTGVLP